MNKVPIHIISTYFRAKQEVAAVYLFGSYAHEQQRPFSDLDLGLLFEHCDRHLIGQQMDRYFIEIARLLKQDPHLVAMNFADERLWKQIFTKGRCILVNNSRTLTSFKMIAYARIADFSFHQKRIEKRFAQKLMQV